MFWGFRFLGKKLISNLTYEEAANFPFGFDI